MIHSFNNKLNEFGINNKNNKIILAVSGGVDSMVMLDLFIKSNISIIICHCNFKLRGSESDNDELFVKEIAAKQNLIIETISFNTTQYAKENKLSIQESARILRYKWFEEIRKKHNGSYISIAHNADDNRETFFINLIRGTGVAGLAGISEKKNYIIRPLLQFNRNEIVNYAQVNSIRYREDSSNSEDKYLRNNIRLNLMPLINSISNDFNTKLSENIDIISKYNQFVNHYINEILNNLTEETNELITINSSKLLEQSFSELLIFHLLKKYSFSIDTINNLSKTKKQITGKKYYSKSHELLIDRGKWLIRSIKDPSNPNILYIYNEGEYSFNDIKIKINKSNIYCQSLNNKQNILQADADKLFFPITIRNWEKGDSFIPLGMKGRKKVSDFFIDSKINHFDKSKALILESNNEIAWIVGHRTSDLFKVSNETKRILIIEILKIE